MNIDKKVVFEQYMQRVDEEAEECDWKTFFSPEEMVSKVVDIIEEIYDANENTSVKILQFCDGFEIGVGGKRFSFNQEDTVEGLKDVFELLGFTSDYEEAY